MSKYQHQTIVIDSEYLVPLIELIQTHEAKYPEEDAKQLVRLIINVANHNRKQDVTIRSIKDQVLELTRLAAFTLKDEALVKVIESEAILNLIKEHYLTFKTLDRLNVGHIEYYPTERYILIDAITVKE